MDYQPVSVAPDEPPTRTYLAPPGSEGTESQAGSDARLMTHFDETTTAATDEPGHGPKENTTPTLSESGPRDGRRYLKSPWLLEVLAVHLSISSLVAAIVVMSRRDGRPITEWSFMMSLNTVVAILGVVSKASMLFAISASLGQHKWNWFRTRRDRLGVFEVFDEASRGPWGGLHLMFRTRLSTWANLGAAVTVVTLFVDPFLQATVAIAGEMRPVDMKQRGPPTIPIATALKVGTVVDTTNPNDPTRLYEGGPQRKELTLWADLGLSSAAYDGFHLSTTGTTSRPTDVSYQCATGNCTFLLAASASICSACNDVSDRVVRVPQDYCAFWNGTDQAVRSTLGIAGPCTAFTLPYSRIKQYNGYLFQPGEEIPSEREWAEQLYHEAGVLLTVNTTTDFPSTISFRDMDTMFFTWLVLDSGEEFQGNKTAWEESHPAATECGLYVCTKASEASVLNGVLTETVKGTWAIREPASWKMADYYPDADSITWDDEHPSLNSSRMSRTDLQISIPRPQFEELRLEGERTFNVSQATLMGLQNVLQRLTLGEANAVAPLVSRGHMVFPASPLSAGEFPVADVFWHHRRDLAPVFERLAHRLSVELRDSSGSVRGGSMEQWVLVVEIRWAFLTLPILGLLGGCVYFVAVLLQTQRLGLPVWKESVYPTLTYGFDETTQALLRSVEQEMDKAPGVEGFRKRMMIGLVPGGNGLKLDATER